MTIGMLSSISLLATSDTSHLHHLMVLCDGRIYDEILSRARLNIYRVMSRKSIALHSAHMVSMSHQDPKTVR